MGCYRPVGENQRQDQRMGKTRLRRILVTARGGNVNVIANLFSDNKLESTRISGYLQDVFKFRTKQGLFTLVGGVRGSYWSYNREFIFSPRASIGFIPNFDQNLTFRLASGLYYQSPFYKELRTTVQDEHGNSIIQLNKT